MKPINIQPEEGKFNFEEADKIVKFAKEKRHEAPLSRTRLAQPSSRMVLLRQERKPNG